MSENIVIGDVRPRIQALGDGVLTEFIYPFAIFKDSDLEVYLDDSLQESGFTITGAGQSDGGSVVFDSPPANNVTVTLRRYLVIERTSDFAEGGAFHALVINQELDYLVAVAQQNAEDVRRSVLLNPTDDSSDLTLPSKSERASKVLAFDEDGVPISGPNVSEIANAASNAQTATDAAISAVEAQNAAEEASAAAQTFDPADYRAKTDLIETNDVADGAITQSKIDPAVQLGGPSLGTNSIMRTNAQTISEDITIPPDTNAMTVGPVTIAEGNSVTIAEGSTWRVV